MNGKSKRTLLRFEVLGSENLAIVQLHSRDSEQALTSLAAARKQGSFAALASAPSSGGVSIVLAESFLQSTQIAKDAVVEKSWIVLNGHFSSQVSNASSTALLAQISSEMADAGISWKSLPGPGVVSLLLRREQLSAAAVVLAAGGHIVGPTALVCPTAPREDPDAKSQNAPYIGVWSLLKKEHPIGCTVEEYAAGEGHFRLQVPSGLYVEVRIPLDNRKNSTSHASHCGYHAVIDDGGRILSVRHRLVDFQPPTGRVHCTQVKFDKDVMGELSHPKGLFREEYIEAWTRMDAGKDPCFAALELVAETPVKMKRCGYWIFCGTQFAKVIGCPVGLGLISGACCSSLHQLAGHHGLQALEEELREHYEVVLGTVESPGRLLVSREAYSKDERRSNAYFDAEQGVGGRIKFGPGYGDMLHILPNGHEQRWRIREWGFDPFTPKPPVKASEGTAPPVKATASKSRSGSRSSSDSDYSASGSKSRSASCSRRRRHKRRRSKSRNRDKKRHKRRRRSRHRSPNEARPAAQVNHAAPMAYPPPPAYPQAYGYPGPPPGWYPGSVPQRSPAGPYGAPPYVPPPMYPPGGWPPHYGNAHAVGAKTLVRGAGPTQDPMHPPYQHPTRPTIPATAGMPPPRPGAPGTAWGEPVPVGNAWGSPMAQPTRPAL